MAKALLGHVGGPDPRLVSEVRRLQKRVSELEAHVMRLQAENDSLNAAVHEGQLLTIEAQHEPALPHEYQFHLDMPDARTALTATLDWLDATTTK